METMRYKNWWALALNGLIAILFGLLLVLFPEGTIKTVVFYFGLVIVVLGLILLWMGIRNARRDKRSYIILLESVFALTIGIIIMFFPGETLTFFMLLIGIWAIITAIVQFVILVHVGSMLPGKNVLLVNAILTLGLGIILLFNPLSFAIFIWKAIGILAILFGCIMIYYAVVIMKIKPDTTGA